MKLSKQKPSLANPSERTQKEKTKKVKLICKHNQNLLKTNFLINLKKIAVICGFLYILINMAGMLLIDFFVYDETPSPIANKRFLAFIIFVMAILLFFVIKKICQIKWIKNHQSNTSNCQKLDQQIQVSIRAFKRKAKIILYLWFGFIFLLIFLRTANLGWLFVIACLLCLCIGFGCIYLIEKPVEDE